MATRYSTYPLRRSQSPAHSYKRDGKTVTEGYDPGNAVYWYRIGFGAVCEFHSQRELDTALSAEFAPTAPLFNAPLPQLPANVPVGTQAQRCALLTQRAHGQSIPTEATIYLPSRVSSDFSPPFSFFANDSRSSFSAIASQAGSGWQGAIQ